MVGQWWKAESSSSNDVDHKTICARRLSVARLREYLSNPKPSFLICSNQCGLLIEAMERVASWLTQWRKSLPAPFVQDMLTLATRGIRLLEEIRHLNSSTWLSMAMFKLESREEFMELFQGFLQNLTGYVEVLQRPLSYASVHGIATSSVAPACIFKACIHDIMSLITSFEDDLGLLPLQSAEDRRALAQSLGHCGIRGSEESKIASWLMERLEDKGKQNNPFQLYSFDIMKGNPKLLGKGTYGQVYELTWRGRTVAVKQFYGQASLDAELNALLKTSHVNVMRAIAHCPETESSRSCLLMEWMQGDLHQFVCKLEKAKVELPLSVTIDILLQIATGMAHLHAKNVMHRDLKPENILFNRWPPMSAQQLQEGPADFTAKITDFGEARTQSFDTTQATAKRGTKCYRAPEILRAVDVDGSARYSKKVDVFSFGMVCYKLLTLKDPCVPEKKALKGDYSELTFSPDLPGALVTLTKRCWSQARHNRPSFREICEFLALFKSIVLNTTPASSVKPPLYLGIRDDVLGKLIKFLGKQWLLREAVSLGIIPEFVKNINRAVIDETRLRLQVVNKLVASSQADYFRWLCCNYRGVWV